MSPALTLPAIRRLRLSATLSFYLARLILFWFLSFLLSLVAIILLVSVVDFLDRLATKEAPLSFVVEMALMKLPFLSQEVLPFTMLFASMTCFWRLTRTHELVVTRAAGVSIWQVLTPILGVALILGGIAVTVLNPVAASFLGRLEQFENKYVRNQTSSLTVSKGGLWLRQVRDDGQEVIHARRASSDPIVLHEVIVFRYQDQDRFLSRLDAPTAELAEGRWILDQAWNSAPGRQPRFFDSFSLPTELTQEKIIESFAPPETVSFWDLPSFITLLEEAGFSALHHRLQFHKLLATPVLFAAMVLLAAVFSLRSQRRGYVGLMIVSGVLTGFLLYFVSSFVFALGLAAKIPATLAAWTPAGVCLMLGVAALLHIEDG